MNISIETCEGLARINPSNNIDKLLLSGKTQFEIVDLDISGPLAMLANWPSSAESFVTEDALR